MSQRKYPFTGHMLKISNDNARSYPQLSLTIERVPGHHDIKGNKEADKLAKDGCDLVPALMGWLRVEKVAPEELGRSLGGHEAAPSIGLQPDYFRLQLTPTFRLRNLQSHNLLETQSNLAGRAHTGSYYSRFIPRNPRNACAVTISRLDNTSSKTAQTMTDIDTS
ncbi:hypothetical protein DL93DRAFT_2100933 [Clavulina sp. PMI_390]|nr:hypothetical protein DL93DRAFT_2100933 [Clavulina sp. PMI_390]